MVVALCHEVGRDVSALNEHSKFNVQKLVNAAKQAFAENLYYMMISMLCASRMMRKRNGSRQSESSSAGE